MSLNISTEKLANVTIVKGDGEMDYHNFRLLKNQVETALAEGDRKLLLDLSDISYLDSSALGSLLYNQKRVHERGGEVLVVAGDPLMDILSLTHLDSHFTIVDSVDEGRRRFSDKGDHQVIPLRVKSSGTEESR